MLLTTPIPPPFPPSPPPTPTPTRTPYDLPETPHLRNIKQHLQLLHQLPLLRTNIRPIILLQRIDALPRNKRVQRVFFFQVAAVHGLVGAFDFHGDGGLAFFADGDLFVVAFDG